jgi:hypothetical protein
MEAAMFLQRAHGIFFVLLGLVSLADGWRIGQQAREGANFDAIGPDRYLLALGVVMLVAGLWGLVKRPELAHAPDAASGQHTGSVTARLVLTVAMIGGLAALTPVVGFPIACALFLTLQFRTLGGWPWWKSAGLAVTIALAFYVTFIALADMPLPKGYIWN